MRAFVLFVIASLSVSFVEAAGATTTTTMATAVDGATDPCSAYNGLSDEVTSTTIRHIYDGNFDDGTVCREAKCGPPKRRDWEEEGCKNDDTCCYKTIRAAAKLCSESQLAPCSVACDAYTVSDCPADPKGPRTEKCAVRNGKCDVDHGKWLLAGDPDKGHQVACPSGYKDIPDMDTCEAATKAMGRGYSKILGKCYVTVGTSMELLCEKATTTTTMAPASVAGATTTTTMATAAVAGTTTTMATMKNKVSVEFTVAALDYDKVMNSTTAKAMVIKDITDAFLAQHSGYVAANVEVTLSKGSVKALVSVTPKAGADSATLKAAMASTKGAIEDAVLTKVVQMVADDPNLLESGKVAADVKVTSAAPMEIVPPGATTAKPADLTSDSSAMVLFTSMIASAFAMSL